MLQRLLVQTRFPQHLVLVEQQLAVLVVHLVWRCLETRRTYVSAGSSKSGHRVPPRSGCSGPLHLSHEGFVFSRWHKDRKQKGLISSPVRGTSIVLVTRDNTHIEICWGLKVNTPPPAVASHLLCFPELLNDLCSHLVVFQQVIGDGVADPGGPLSWAQL